MKKVQRKSEVLREGVIMGISQAISMLKEAVDSTETYIAEITEILCDEWKGLRDCRAHEVERIKNYDGKTFAFSTVDGFIKGLADILGIEEDDILAPKPMDDDAAGVVSSWVGDESMNIDDTGNKVYDVYCRFINNDGKVVEGPEIEEFCANK